MLLQNLIKIEQFLRELSRPQEQKKLTFPFSIPFKHLKKIISEFWAVTDEFPPINSFILYY